MKNEYLTENIDIIDSPKEIKQILKQNWVETIKDLCSKTKTDLKNMRLSFVWNKQDTSRGSTAWIKLTKVWVTLFRMVNINDKWILRRCKEIYSWQVRNW